MEEIIDLLSAYYTALLEKQYMDEYGRSTGRGRAADSRYFILNPIRDVSSNIINTDRESIKKLIEEGYSFRLFSENCIYWVHYKDGLWISFHKTFSMSEMINLIHSSTIILGLEQQPSEMSIAARLLDDEMAYEI